MKQLSTVHEVIEALGGDEAFGALIGVGVKSVQHMKWKKVFPAKTYLAIISELGKSGVGADPSLWKFIAPSEEGRPFRGGDVEGDSDQAQGTGEASDMGEGTAAHGADADAVAAEEIAAE